MATGNGQDVFAGTIFQAGTWGSGGQDDIGLYSGGSAGTGTATLTGTVSASGDPVAAVLNGVHVTLYAYSDLTGGGGIVLTDGNATHPTLYIFLTSRFRPAQQYPLAYTFGGFDPPCFVTGTRLATARGEVAVEALRVGDLVLALRARRFAEVVWIGRRRLLCAGHPRGHDVWPVRIAAHAFATDLPARDLLLSPDHGLYLDGMLVPVRYLLNGATVAQIPVADVTYWHVELATHDLLSAEGLPAESYLDTGNRRAFQHVSGPSPRRVVERRLAWQTHACAPLQLDAGAHRPVRARLLARVGALGFSATDDPGLRLLAGAVSLPLWRAGDTWQADIPAKLRELRLVSRAAVPAEILPDATDARRLGLAVTRLTLDGETIAAEDARRGSGWHVPEPGLHWTDGDAVLRLGRGRGGPRRLAITAAPLLSYWVPPPGRAVAASPAPTATAAAA